MKYADLYSKAESQIHGGVMGGNFNKVSVLGESITNHPDRGMVKRRG
jgi:hypothetical protein